MCYHTLGLHRFSSTSLNISLTTFSLFVWRKETACARFYLMVTEASMREPVINFPTFVQKDQWNMKIHIDFHKFPEHSLRVECMRKYTEIPVRNKLLPFSYVPMLLIFNCWFRSIVAVNGGLQRYMLQSVLGWPIIFYLANKQIWGKDRQDIKHKNLSSNRVAPSSLNISKLVSLQLLPYYFNLK